MKLYACFTVFDGLELLEKAVENILPYVHGVIICYQEVSNKGNYSPDVAIRLKAFVNDPEVIFVKYQTDMALGTKENERRKHNLMISRARDLGATHFIMMATDHFYFPQEIFNCRRDVEANDWDATFTGMYTYYKHPTYQLTPVETYFMPFICKLYPHTKIERVRPFPVFVDPSVQMNTHQRHKVYLESECMLHHYSMVREHEGSIKTKFLNAASPWTDDQITDFLDEYRKFDPLGISGPFRISYFQDRQVKIVEDYFGLSSIFRTQKQQ